MGKVPSRFHSFLTEDACRRECKAIELKDKTPKQWFFELFDELKDEELFLLAVKLLDYDAVYDFLRSEVGMLAFRRLSHDEILSLFDDERIANLLLDNELLRKSIDKELWGKLMSLLMKSTDTDILEKMIRLKVLPLDELIEVLMELIKEDGLFHGSIVGRTKNLLDLIRKANPATFSAAMERALRKIYQDAILHDCGDRYVEEVDEKRINNTLNILKELGGRKEMIDNLGGFIKYIQQERPKTVWRYIYQKPGETEEEFLKRADEEGLSTMDAGVGPTAEELGAFVRKCREKYLVS